MTVPDPQSPVETDGDRGVSSQTLPAGHLTPTEHSALYWALGPSIDDVSQQTGVGGHAHRSQRHLLLPALHAVNDEMGWISPTAIDTIAHRLGLGAAEVYSVASFYDLFSLTERPRRYVRACVDLACRAADPDLTASLPDEVAESPCLGMCEQAPAALVADGEHKASIGQIDRERLMALSTGATIPVGAELAQVASVVPEATDSLRGDVQQSSTELVLLARVGTAPLDLDLYLNSGGFIAAEAAWAMEPSAIIDAVSASGLIGRGGAGFPTGRKWAAVASQDTNDRYLICNADESEPGTFKDRAVMENDPFGVLESILIASRAIGAATAYIYLRGEYPRAWHMLHSALDQLHRDPRTSDYFDNHRIVLFKGAGAYICGEETAIFSSIEGYRGEPRSKPPFPFEVGLFGQPTAVNNVETLINVLPIIEAAARGEVWSARRRLFCVSGMVHRPGVYEVELGTRLSALIELAGGAHDGRQIQAVLLGGAAGGFVGPSDLDLILDHDSVRAAGHTLGSGVVMVLDDQVDLKDQVLRIAEFFRHESCGQCAPCRVGTVRQHEALERLASGTDPVGTRALLAEINQVMTDASICGLGQTAGNAVSVAINSLGVFDDV